MTYKGVAKGKTIELEEYLPYSKGQQLRILVEPFTGLPRSGFSAAIRQVMHEPPHLSEEDVDQLERAIEESKLPVHQESVFDEEK